MSLISNLERQILEAKAAYYNSGTPIISDQLFDKLVDQLSAIDPENPAILDVGIKPVSNWEKYAHLVPMGSLNKCKNAEEYKKWNDKYIDDNDDIFVTLKLDGLSVSLIYENGQLVKAATRGSGNIGELITNNAIHMMCVPRELPVKINATIRGEIVLSKQNHITYFTDYSSARNAASGISRRYDGYGVDKLSIIVYEILTDVIEINTEQQQFEILQSLGFTVPIFHILKTSEEVIALQYEYQNSLRNEYLFELDGLVIHNNSILKQRAHGSLHAKPYAVIAFKFKADSAETIVRNISVQVGNSGRLTPVLEVEPVHLVGAEISRASLYNFGYIKEIGLDVGAKVLIVRANDVIPRCEVVLESTGTVFQPPKNCPACNSEVVMIGENLQCMNTDICPAQITGRLNNWIHTLGILEWGDKLLAKLVDIGMVNTVADLYKLQTDDLAKLDRMGEKSANNCYKTLWECNPITLDIFIGGLSIPLIGSASIQMAISHGLDSLDKLRTASYDSLLQIKGLGPLKARSLFVGIRRNNDIINALLNAGLKIQNGVNDQNLKGKVFTITGPTNIKRAELAKIIVKYGGRFKSSVTQDCSHLIVADPNKMSTKIQGALKMGIKMISEDDFLSMLHEK